MKFWSLVFLVFVLVLFASNAKSQTQITSQNILTPTVDAWTGSVAGQNGGYSGGGNGPAFNATTNTLIFGYTTATATQRITAEAFAIQHALDLSYLFHYGCGFFVDVFSLRHSVRIVRFA